LIVRRVPFTAAEIAKRRGSRRLKTIHPEQLQLALEGKVASVYGHSFILADIHWQPAVWIEHFHRHRAQIEERLKEAKLGQALRHLPSANQHANRVWLQAALLALNLTALCCDLCPAAGASGKAPTDAPLRRTAKTLRRILFNVPRQDRPQRPSDDPQAPRRLPPRRRLPGHTRRDLPAAALTPRGSPAGPTSTPPAPPSLATPKTRPQRRSTGPTGHPRTDSLHATTSSHRDHAQITPDGTRPQRYSLI
jgi:hypothetical protein